jgi:flagellar motor switch protein FliN/FliY
VALQDLAAASQTGELSAAPDLSILHDVDVQLEVRLGRTDFKVRELLQLGPGSTVSLDQNLDQDVEILLNGKVIALGAIVAVNDHFAVQVTRTVEAGGRIPLGVAG